MNQFKIEVKEILKRDVIVKAKTEESALKIIENILLKSNILDLNTKDLQAVEVKILERNGDKIDENIDDENWGYEDGGQKWMS